MILFALGKERGKKEGKGELVATVEEKWLVVILLWPVFYFIPKKRIYECIYLWIIIIIIIIFG